MMTCITAAVPRARPREAPFLSFDRVELFVMSFSFLVREPCLSVVLWDLARNVRRRLPWPRRHGLDFWCRFATLRHRNSSFSYRDVGFPHAIWPIALPGPLLVRRHEP